MKPVPESFDVDHGKRFQLLAVGYFALLAVTWPLWLPQSDFPQIPLISFAGRRTAVIEYGLFAFLLGNLGVMAFSQIAIGRRWASLLVGLTTMGLVTIDQHRLQPWAWQFVIVSSILSCADFLTALAAWRWLVIGIYAWSSWSKLDQSFCLQHGPFLLEGLFSSVGLKTLLRSWPEIVRFRLALAIPIVELLIAVGLGWQRTRRSAMFAAAAMHIALIFALGPFGHRHQPGVLVWNVFFLVQNWMLFSGPRNPDRAIQSAANSSVSQSARTGNSFAKLIVLMALIWPALEPFGLCDHWPAWAVYAAKPERVTVYLDESELSQLPEGMKKYMGPQAVFDEWHPFRIDRWSLDSVYVPIYPQDRFQVGVALGLARDFGLKHLRIVIEGPANRWTGQRTVHEFVGLEAIETLVDSYRVNARPR